MQDEPITLTSTPPKKQPNTIIIGAILVILFTILFSWFLFTRPEDDSSNISTEPTPTPTVEALPDETTNDEGELTGFEFEQNTVFRVTDTGRSEIITPDELNDAAPGDSATMKSISWNFGLEKLFMYVNVESTMEYLLFSDLFGDSIKGVDYVVQAAISPDGSLIAYTKLDELQLRDFYLYNLVSQEYEQVLNLNDPACEMNYTTIEWQSSDTLSTEYEGYECDDNQTKINEGTHLISVTGYFNSN